MPFEAQRQQAGAHAFGQEDVDLGEAVAFARSDVADACRGVVDEGCERVEVAAFRQIFDGSRDAGEASAGWHGLFA